MGKHDEQSHQLHIPKKLKFQQARPAIPATPETAHAPQEPKPGTNSKNHFR